MSSACGGPFGPCLRQWLYHYPVSSSDHSWILERTRRKQTCMSFTCKAFPVSEYLQLKEFRGANKIAYQTSRFSTKFFLSCASLHFICPVYSRGELVNEVFLASYPSHPWKTVVSPFRVCLASPTHRNCTSPSAFALGNCKAEVPFLFLMFLST